MHDKEILLNVESTSLWCDSQRFTHHYSPLSMKLYGEQRLKESFDDLPTISSISGCSSFGSVEVLYGGLKG